MDKAKARTNRASAGQTRDRIEAEPGAEKRLASILKRALNTPPKHASAKGKKQSTSKSSGRD
jgi:hypothetical protein